MLSPRELGEMMKMKTKSAEEKTSEKLRGENDRLRGQIKREKTRSARAEKLAFARLKTIGRLDARKGLKV